MAEEKSDLINGFPSDFAPKSEKLSKEYILKYCDAAWGIYKKSFYGQDEQRGQCMLNRKFAEGLQSIDEMKQFFTIDGDLSMLNLDWKPINRIATVIDNMVGMITSQIYKIRVMPSDTLSKSKYEAERNKLRANIIIAKALAEHKIPERTGINPLAGQTVLEDEDEINLHMRMNFKTDEALAMELALRWVLDNNNFDKESIPEIVRDLLVDKKTCVKHYYDSKRNIRAHRFDHLDVLTPYSKDPRFRKLNYQMFKDQFTIGKIAEMNPDLTEEDLWNIAHQYAGNTVNPAWNSNWSSSYEGYYASNPTGGIRPYQNFMILVCELYFLTPITETTKTVKHKKSRTSKVEISRDNETGADFRVVDQAKNTKCYRIEGMWIPETKYLWNYGMSKNLERDLVPGGYSPDCELPGVIIAPNIYDMKNKSIVERCIPFEKQMNLSYLKLQQSKIMAAPDGIAIDERGLDIADEQGQGQGKTKHSEKFKQYRQTGSFTYYGWDDMNNQLINIPFKEMIGGMKGSQEGYIQDINLNVDLINKVVGFNTAVDASTPNTDAPVGTSQMAAQATYNCMKPIVFACIDVVNRTAKQLALKIQDSIKLNNPAFVEAIGQSCSDVLLLGRKMAFSTENIQIEAMPDIAEQKDLMALISLGIENKTLMPSDVLQIQMQMKSDVTLAGQMLVMFENKNAKAQAQAALVPIQENAKAQQQSNAQAAQAAKELEKIKTDSAIAFLQEEYRLRGILQTQVDTGVMNHQFITNEGNLNVEKQKEQKEISVTQITKDGKLGVAHIQSATKITSDNINHHSSVQTNLQKHDQAKELSEQESEQAIAESKAAPKPTKTAA